MKDLVGIVLFSRLLIILIVIVSSVIPDFLQNGVPRVKIPILGLFAKWDSFYYIDIATYGYSLKAEFWAFRPFYPLILWSLGSPLTGFLGKWESFLIAGVFWNIFAFSLAAIYLYKLTKLLIDEETAYLTVLLLSMFPATVFFTAVYPESTYLLLVVASLYYLEKGRIPLAALLATLAGFTRPEGFLLFIPFVWKAFTLKGNEKLKSLLGSMTVAYTLPAFMLYGYVITGDPFISFTVESSWPKATLWQCLVFGFREGLDKLTVYSISTIVLVIAILSVVLYFFHFRVSKWGFSVASKLDRHDKRMPYYLWTILLLGVFLYTGEYAGFSRYASILFPILWSNALWVKKKQTRLLVLLSLYVSLMALGTMFFVNWYYFI